MTETEQIPSYGSGLYLKTCAGCKKPFRTDARNARFGPPELCKCLEKRAKHRAKRARERRAYRKNPEEFRARSRSRQQARKAVLALFGVEVKGKKIVLTPGEFHEDQLRCDSPGCHHTFDHHLEKVLTERAENGVGPRGARHEAIARLLRNLEAHHRDHDPFNNRIDYYPEGSNVQLLCRKHHEQADRAKAGKAQIELWSPPKDQTWLEFLLSLRTDAPRRFFTIPVHDLYTEYSR